MAADTMGCRVATVIYGALGIPLFFAFIKEEGNLFRLCFIWIYKFIQKIHVQSCHLFVLGEFPSHLYTDYFLFFVFCCIHVVHCN